MDMGKTIRKMMGKIVAIGLAASVLASALPIGTGVQAANTSGSFAERIGQLQGKFPAGKYWNHMGSSANNPDGYTSTPCTHHGGCSRNGYNGWCGCNSFNNQSIQCFGFAEKLGYDVFGTNPRSWAKTYSISNVQAGDIIRYKNNGHSIFVTNVSGNSITYADCNSDGHCKIRWNATIKKSDVWGLSYISHAGNYQDVMSISSDTEKPSVSDVKIESVDANGYTVVAKVSDNVGIASVKCATWTSGNDQDDLIWKDMAVSGDKAWVYISFAEHGGYVDYYNNHVYAYDAAGNYAAMAAEYDRCEDIGTDFYAKIANKKLNRVVANLDDNAVSVSDRQDAGTLWKFERQADHSYKIISCLDGNVLEVKGSDSSEGANVQVGAWGNGGNQKWYVSKNAGGYALMPACAQGRAVDVKDISAAENANIQIWGWGYNNDAQVYGINRISDVGGYYPSMQAPKLCSQPSLDEECTEFRPGDTLYFQAQCKNAEKFYVKMQKDGKVVLENTVAAGKYKYLDLAEGNYRMDFTPVNEISSSSGTVTKTFAVKQEEAKEEVKPDPEEPKEEADPEPEEPKGEEDSEPEEPKEEVKPEQAEPEEPKGEEDSEPEEPKEEVKPDSEEPKEEVKPDSEEPKEEVKPEQAEPEEPKEEEQEDSEPEKPKEEKAGDVTGFCVKSEKTTSITLSWKGAKNASGYEIYRYPADSSKVEKKVKLSGAKSVSYTDKGLKQATAYRYRIRAYSVKNGKVSYGGFSEMIKGYTMLVKPKAQMIKIKFLRQANLLWKKVKNASGYEVYRSESKKGKYVKVRTVLKSKAINYYRDKNLKKNKSYYYKIRAYKTIDGKKIYSDYSAVKTARM